MSFAEHVDKLLKIGDKFKRAMQKKGLRRARAKCPDCPGKYLHGSLNGKKDHLHFTCDCRKYTMLE